MNNRHTTVALIAIILILGFATIDGAFLTPDTALAKKSKHNSNNDDTSTSSPPPSSTVGNYADGYEAGKGDGRDAANSGQTSFASCPREFADNIAYCTGYHAGYIFAYNAAKALK